MLERFLILPFFLCATLALAQNAPAEFGDVSVEELMSKKYADTASAIILFDKGNLNIDPYSATGTTYKRHLRIKILNKIAFESWWGNLRLTVNKKSLASVKAVCYNLENGVVQKSELGKSSIYKDKYDKDLEQVNFAIPNVKEGSVIEIMFTVKLEGLYLTSWTFQSTIPTLWSEYTLYSPSEDFVTHLRGSIQPTRHDSKYKGRSQSWVMTNLPAFRTEPGMPDETVYLSRVEFATELNSWLKIYTHFVYEESFSTIVHKHNYLKDIVEELTAGLTDPRQKIKVISEYLKKEVQWDEDLDFYARVPSEVLKKKSGSSGDINLLFASMLEKAGLKVNMVLLSTRDHGLIMEDFPSLSQFDYVVCEVALPEGELLVDATEKYLPFDMLPGRCFNHKGFLIGTNQYGWISIEPVRREKISVDANLALAEDGALKGKVSITRDGYAAFNSRKRYFLDGEEKYKSDLINREQLNKQGLELQNMNEIEKPVVVNYEVAMDSYATTSNDLIYLNPNIFLRDEFNPYVLSERKYPIDFEMLTDQTVVGTFTLPEGFAVEELPQSKASIITGNAAKFTFNVSQSGNRIMVVSKLQINKTLFQPSEYIGLKEFYDRLVAKKAESIVLRRKK